MGIKKVKIFDVDFDVVRLMVGMDIEVMVVVLNDMFVMFVKDLEVFDVWVRENVIFFNFEEGVYIRY